jgi:hypothetical protein
MGVHPSARRFELCDGFAEIGHGLFHGDEEGAEAASRRGKVLAYSGFPVTSSDPRRVFASTRIMIALYINDATDAARALADSRANVQYFAKYCTADA